MTQIIVLSVKGIIRDRVLHGVGIVSLFLLFIPSLSSLSMRQVAELSITLSLSFISFLLVVLSIFLGGTQLWKDIERRYTFSVLSLPVSRTSYLLGKYAAVACFIATVCGILLCASLAVIMISSTTHAPDRPVAWDAIVLCVLFDAMKALLLVAFAFLFSTVSTSLFLPIFGTIAIYFAGNASQQVYEYITAGGGQQLPEIMRLTTKILYYVLPNLSAFDLKTYAIYSVPLDLQGLATTSAYFVVYTAIVLLCASMIFSRKEMN
ncbi:ABC transporter permease subunit [Geobacter sulfurreducens]|uniref:Membrane protein, putative n=1 Tax=Geobacter sulfurreducens (strain ATCC 51573 / DSM 12127 / PCA) TaxID=243231 RepID=Q74D20_GEOSL|nr:ABC-2 transporter permease [Geobacter sulfurreducens]AAR34873.1 membrane protein, putative [Geobacter sulfurreducens PCA]ADI84337.2 membrane protein, putative [Geobacter sulfurreducens KN400]UAC05510.1 ABC transporter permease subunit [Geobacter sulfurreducens]HBB68991.1 hypothetical protein [Geobacter sulfurreducens]HCD96285.1 hypothetical protein [Geobacter sulfurreducens]